MPDVALHLELSHKLATDDLDWDLARRHGLDAREAYCLQYFADIESQTVFYMLEVAKLEVARDPDLLAFLAVWNYEELFHAHAIARLLEACGVVAPPPTERSREVRGAARLRARLEDRAQTMIARFAPRTFVALWQAWGAAAELLTTQAYEELGRRTGNPVLRELCRRIARQERRHFAWYHEAARERLAGEPVAQRVVRAAFEVGWTPVGSGVKGPEQSARLLASLYAPARLREVFAEVDRRMAQLPGMAGFDVCTRYLERVWDDVERARPAEAPAPVPLPGLARRAG